MPIGVLYALIAYGSFSVADAIVKSFSGIMSVWQIAFFSALFGLIPALFVRPPTERWRDSFRLRHPWLLQLRALTGFASTALVIFAFTTIPFAEAYAIVFLTPIVVLVVSGVLLGERVSRRQWLLGLLCFVGVLIVVRPGFREMQPGHLAALGCAVLGAITTTVLRFIAGTEKRTSVIAVVSLYALVLNGLLMLPGFVMPTLAQLGSLMLIGAFGGIGTLMFLAAAKAAPASLIAPTQYSQVVWAIILGGFFYAEYPDTITYLGIAVVVVAGIVNVLSDEARARLLRPWSARRRPPMPSIGPTGGAGA